MISKPWNDSDQIEKVPGGWKSGLLVKKPHPNFQK